MAKTQKQLLALLKKPNAFLRAYANERAELIAAVHNSENGDTITGGDLIESDYVTIINFIEEECLNAPFEGITLAEVYSVGGGEGSGESVIRVWSVSLDGDALAHIRVTGYYESYNGTEYNDDEADLVEPHNVVETRYFTKAERKRAAKTTRFV